MEGCTTTQGRPTPWETRTGSCGTSTRSSTDRASDYGSEGWGFESLRVHVTVITAQDKASLLRDACRYLESYGWDCEYLHNPTSQRSGRLSLAGALMLAASGDYHWRSKDERQCELLKFAAQELVRQEPSLAKVRTTDRARDLRIISRWEGAHDRTQEQVKDFLTALADSTWKPAPIRRRTLGTEARAYRIAEECGESSLDQWFRAQEAPGRSAGSRPSPERSYRDLSLDPRMLEEIRAACVQPRYRLVDACDQEFTRSHPED